MTWNISKEGNKVYVEPDIYSAKFQIEIENQDFASDLVIEKNTYNRNLLIISPAREGVEIWDKVNEFYNSFKEELFKDRDDNRQNKTWMGRSKGYVDKNTERDGIEKDIKRPSRWN